jgi:hypothetical protein
METLIGVAGGLIILVFFLLNQFHKTDEDNFWYDAGNLLGSALLMLYAYLIGSWPFLALNAVWAAFSLKDVIWRKRT